MQSFGLTITRRLFENMEKEFWKSWKRKTKIEKKAIKAVEKARELVVKCVPKGKVVAIYIKGSFARREMKNGSDVDVVPIVTKTKYEGKVFEVNSMGVKPCIVVPLSLEEFRKNKLMTSYKRSIDLRAKPDRLLAKLDECKLIYGNGLDAEKFPKRSDEKALKEEIKVLLKGYIPFYQKGELKFDFLLKEVFWLIELEQQVKGIKVKHSFKGIAEGIRDKNHIIHDAYKFRKKELKGKGDEKRFIMKLKKHLEKLK